MKSTKPRQHEMLQIGDRFSRLTVIGKPFRVRLPQKPGQLMHFAICECDCGEIALCEIVKLYSGNTRSCGCYQKTAVSVANKTHGKCRTRLHSTWLSMRFRCNNPNAAWYRIYGGRGIRVCEEWNSFESFQEWALANGYTDNLTIDRIDCNGHYCPENCRWATNIEQSNNKRNNRFVTAFGETKTLSQWAADRRSTVSRGSIEKRIRRGMSPEMAISLPNSSAIKIEK